MFFFMPMAFGRIIFIYILAAIIPAIFLLWYVYKQDTIEKEPPRLLRSLIGYGIVAALCSIVLEWVGNLILDNTLSKESPYYILVFAFLVVAAVEEGTKMFFLKRRTWNDWNFSHLYDGVVYSVCVSLGFAAFENIKYVFTYGLSVVLPRALFASPGHLGFSVFMGVFYGRAKLCENRGNTVGKIINLTLGYVSAVLLHGFYDACAMNGSTTANMIFYGFVAVMYVVVYHMIKKASKEDQPVY